MKKKVFIFSLIIISLLSGIIIGTKVKKRDNPRFKQVENSAYYVSKKIDKEYKGAIVNAVLKVAPAVVSIETEYEEIRRSNTDLFEKFFRDFFGDKPYDNYQRKRMSLGSGAIFSPDGLILTADHVVEGGKNIKVTLPDGRHFSAKILGEDAINDLALLKIDGENLPYITLGDSDKLLPGEWVIALGNPFGLMVNDPQPTVTVGVVSANMRTISMKDETGEKMFYGLIQTDAAINPGNSGGPLVDADGTLVGINTAIFSTSGGSQGIGFAISVNTAKKSIDDILKYGEVRRGWIGVIAKEIPYDLKKKYGLDKVYGVLVTTILKNSPAYRDGLREGDVIVSFNKLPIRNIRWWKGYLMRISPDVPVKLSVLRDSENLNISITPELFNSEKILRSLGILKIKELTYTDALKYHLTLQKGLLIENVAKGSIAYKNGLRKNQVIRAVNNIRIYDKNDLNFVFSKIAQGNKISFVVEKSGYFYRVEVQF